MNHRGPLDLWLLTGLLPFRWSRQRAGTTAVLDAMALFRLCTLAFALTTAPAVFAESILLRGAKIHTLAGPGTLEQSDLLIEGERVAAIGAHLDAGGARVIDLRGRQITPGLFDSRTTLGLTDVEAVDASRDDQLDADASLGSGFDVALALNPDSMAIPISRRTGVTRAVVRPLAGAGIFAGQGTLIRLAPGAIATGRASGLYIQLGESGSELSDGSRAVALIELAEALEDARYYDAHRAAYDQGQTRLEHWRRADLEALLRVAQGRLPLVMEVHRADEILRCLDFARQHRVRVLLSGATEAWKVAGAIAAAGVPLLIDNLANLPTTFERLGARLDQPALLHQAGVSFALITGGIFDSKHLTQAAGNAVAHGLPWEEALKAITLNPARIWGLDAELGTLEAGRLADLVVWDGDPLELTSHPELVLIEGREAPLDSRQTRLRDRYRDLRDRSRPFGYR